MDIPFLRNTISFSIEPELLQKILITEQI